MLVVQQQQQFLAPAAFCSGTEAGAHTSNWLLLVRGDRADCLLLSPLSLTAWICWRFF